MVQAPSFKEKLQYKFDNIFSKGPRIMFLWLAIGSISLIVLFASLLTIFQIAPPGQENLNFIDSFWISLLHTLSSGTLARSEGWPYKLYMLSVTLIGVFVISAVIGIISTSIRSRLTSLQRGRSKVVEKNHTVILGWTEHVFTIVHEICIANENQKDGCIVIMGDEDKLNMEEQMREKIPNTGITRIVCRRGSPNNPTSLDILSLNFAKSIIVLSPKSEYPDSEVIKICLAIMHHTLCTPKPFHIVAELRQKKNLGVAKIVGGQEVEWILSEDIIARIIAQTCHQSGLSTIYTDLMDYAGDEIYFYSHPKLINKLFGEILFLFEKNAVMGLVKNGYPPELNPPMLTKFEEGDQIIIIAEDDDKIFINDSDLLSIKEEMIEDIEVIVEEPEKILLLGWNSKAYMILKEMDHYILPESEILVVANKSIVSNEPSWDNMNLKNANVKHIYGDTSDRDILESLEPHNFDHIVLLSYSDHLSYQVADAKTLITLLHLRDIANKCNMTQFSIVTEMLDVRNRNLAEVTEVDDFIISDKYISLLLSQVSETKLLHGVFKDILNADGSEVYLKPAVNYIKLGQPINYYTVLEAARRKGEVALGYTIGSDTYDSEKDYGIVLNPFKSQFRNYKMEDKIIVLAETFN